MPISTTIDPTGPTVRTGQGSAINNREDLSSMLTILAPEETPILSLAPKRGKMESTFTEWPIDKLAAPNKTGVAEGADITAFANKFDAVARLGNYCTILERPWAVSDLQTVVKSAGPQDKGRAITKSIQELKRDIEYKISSDDDRSAQDGGGTVYGSRGLGDWIDSAGPSDVPAAYRTPSASIITAAPTEDTLDAAMASIFTVNGKQNRLTLVAGTALRKVITEFTRTENNSGSEVYQVVEQAGTKKVTFVIDTFECAYGFVNIINANPDCVVNSNRGYILNTGYYGMKDLLPMQVKELEDQGGGPRGYVKWAGALLVNHPGAHGKIAY